MLDNVTHYDADCGKKKKKKVVKKDEGGPKEARAESKKESRNRQSHFYTQGSKEKTCPHTAQAQSMQRYWKVNEEWIKSNNNG